MERRKFQASITFRSSKPMAMAEPGWKAPYWPWPGPKRTVLTGWSGRAHARNIPLLPS
jgi:hypothetical protein